MYKMEVEQYGQIVHRTNVNSHELELVAVQLQELFQDSKVVVWVDNQRYPWEYWA